MRHKASFVWQRLFLDKSGKIDFIERSRVVLWRTIPKMSLIELLILLVVAAICGGIGQALVGYSAGGCLISIFVGIVGAYLGVWIARQFGLPIFLPIDIGGTTFPLIWSIIGAAVFSAILGLINRAIVGSRRRY
jgi:uncharacterized membrane protein YeaQ/YmgE (transglycosylase-associated protein family)